MDRTPWMYIDWHDPGFNWQTHAYITEENQLGSSLAAYYFAEYYSLLFLGAIQHSHSEL